MEPFLNNIYLFNVEYKQTAIEKQKNFYLGNKIRPYPRRHANFFN